MQAYHNDKDIKTKYINRVKAHRLADAYDAADAADDRQKFWLSAADKLIELIKECK